MNDDLKKKKKKSKQGTGDKDKRVQFWNQPERGRWLRIYDQRLQQDPPSRAFDFANEDLTMRRRVLPYDPDNALGRLEALELAEQLIDEQLAQRRAEVGETVSSKFGTEQLEQLRERVRASRLPASDRLFV